MDVETITRARAAVARLRKAIPDADPGPWPTEAYYDAIEAMYSAAPALLALAEAAGRLAYGADPSWWGHWSRPDLDGVRFVVCDHCWRHGLPGGDARTVDHKDCPALDIDAALAQLAALDGDADAGEVLR